MSDEIVFSGYARCKHCLNYKMTYLVKGGCEQCNRRELEYGVVHKGDFIHYGELLHRIENGEAFIDGSNYSLPITKRSFD